MHAVCGACGPRALVSEKPGTNRKWRLSPAGVREAIRSDPLERGGTSGSAGCKVLRGRSPPRPAQRPPIESDRYQRAKRLFIEALAQPASVRADFVTHAAEDTSLCAEVLELLQLHYQAAGGDADDPAHAPPDRIGPYQILGMLGRGGMGVVYRARRGDEPPVALKVLEPGVLSGRFISRFRREAEALRRLDHPGIARFLDSGSYESAVGTRPYVAMELVEGTSLRERARDPDWPASARIALLADLAEALHHAHEQGVVHRDLKPDNVVVTAAGKPKVLDFGVARITADELRAGTLATGTGVLLGTVRYMSPEQAQGLTDEIDRRSDVYALGVLAYELLSGTLPYALHTRSVTRALVQVATVPARPLGDVRPSLRGPIERIVARALAKHPADRYPTAAELAADLRRHLAGERVRAPGPSLPERMSRLAREQPWLTASAVLALATLGVIALRGLQGSRDVARSAAADLATERACALLDSVDFRLHHSPRTVASLAAARDLLRQAQVEIRTIGRRDYADDLRRYAAWREGEGWFFLASLDADPERFLLAAAAWDRARAIARPWGFRPRLPDTTVTIYPRLLAVMPQQADAGMALAYSEVARDRAPARHGQLAVQHNRAAWTTFAGANGLDTDPLRGTPPASGVAARLLNDLGASVAATGFYLDSLRGIDEGLALGRRAEEANGLAGDPMAAASLQHNLGQSWLWRARLHRDPADVDSAISRLERALAERAALAGSTSLFETQAVLSAALRLRARLAPSGSQRRDLVRAGNLVRLDRSEAPIGGGVSLAERLTLALGAATVDLAVLDRDPTLLATADSLLASLNGLVPHAGFPVVYARLERERGRVAAARWYLTGEPRQRTIALARFSAAADVFTEGQHRPFRREASEALGRLAAPRGEIPSLADPGLWP